MDVEVWVWGMTDILWEGINWQQIVKVQKRKEKKPLSSWYKEYVVKSTVQVMSKGRGEKVQQTTSLGD